MEEKIYLNSNEKLARSVTGLETAAKHFVVNGESADKVFKREAVSKFNTKVSEYSEKVNKYETLVKECQEGLSSDLNNLQMKPLGNYVIVKPYATNPFQQIKKTDSGIILDLGGMAPEIKSNETGEYEEEELYVKTGVVIEAAPECKYVRVGDTIFWTKPSEVMIPFFKQGLMLVNETRILAIINSDLDSRPCYANKN